MKSTARAPSNIAFIKFMGKTDENLRLPSNTSISMCLSDAITTTTVEFSPQYKNDQIDIRGDVFNNQENERIVSHLDRIRKRAKVKLFAKVATQNSFPKGSGIASSASGFAALTLAGTKACGLAIPEKELTILSRLASGSSCRSIPDGFVQWEKSTTSDDSYAYSLYPPEYWDIRDIVAVVEDKPKAVPTTSAHSLVATSRFFKARMENIDNTISLLKHALDRKDFPSFGETVENEALNMHAVLMTATPPLLYWNESTMSVIRAVWSWRLKGLRVYFTIDAGPNVHVLCEGKTEKTVVSYLKDISAIQNFSINKPAIGARVIENHLF